MSKNTHEDLAAFLVRSGQGEQLSVEENLGEGFVRLRVAEAERRQAKDDIRCVEDAEIELLRNAYDARASTILIATNLSDGKRSLTVVDDGDGIPQDMWERVFEARVTGKLKSVHVDTYGIHGRGMALYSIRENVEQARVVNSGTSLGTSIQVVFDTQKIPEKKDQSSWPELAPNEGGKVHIVRGPHNLIRCACDFCLAASRRCSIFIGSAAEVIAAAIRYTPLPQGSASELMGVKLNELPLLTRLKLASNAHELAEVANSLGLTISERSAQRILTGQIEPAPDVYTYCTHAKPAIETPSPLNPPRRSANLEKDRRGLKLSPEDREAFEKLMEKDFAYLEERYYLHLNGTPTVQLTSGKVTVTFPYRKED
ncbi:ATP-binding protein [Atopobium sp. oral taxon 416]|jgi:hypothetical protein|uniref:ATP-binding protein n=1 Tax=Atopobium sp. oral taxon 416 TaxID=712157 RepID=UPI001BAD9820|nr:ATP-binding protein [Atopobium sp. oral taxon 416]QUC02128.1 ATP-binding protein [Atopobium sp. oral taxon 416]